MKKIFKFMKKIVINALLLYGYNMIISPLGLTIPINIITVLLLSIFGFPALFALIFILIVAF